MNYDSRRLMHAEGHKVCLCVYLAWLLLFNPRKVTVINCGHRCTEQLETQEKEKNHLTPSKVTTNELWVMYSLLHALFRLEFWLLSRAPHRPFSLLFHRTLTTLLSSSFTSPAQLVTVYASLCRLCALLFTIRMTIRSEKSILYPTRTSLLLSSLSPSHTPHLFMKSFNTV